MQDEPQLFDSETRKALQRKLSDVGFYDGAIDGLYGAGTQAAIRAAFGMDETEVQAEAAETIAETEGGNAVADPVVKASATPEEAPTEERAEAGEPSPEIDAEPEPGADKNVTPVLRPKQAKRE